ncbi:hypothetical protein [Cohnella zeiphila]
MKKQSIYAHFKGKDELFMHILRDAKEIELSSKLRYVSEMVDSLMLSLVYDNDENRLNEKLEASWTVFWRGISRR